MAGQRLSEYYSRRGTSKKWRRMAGWQSSLAHHGVTPDLIRHNVKLCHFLQQIKGREVRKTRKCLVTPIDVRALHNGRPPHHRTPPMYRHPSSPLSAGPRRPISREQVHLLAAPLFSANLGRIPAKLRVSC